MDGMKWLGWALVIVAVYEALGLLVTTVPAIITNITWGWVSAVVVLLLGIWALMKS